MSDTKTIATVRDFVEAMGGTGCVAEWAVTTDSAVSNWLARGYLPSGYHLRALVWLHCNGYAAAPQLFELPESDVQALGALPLGVAAENVIAA